VRADICEEPRKAGIGTKWIGHVPTTKINEPVVALRGVTIKPVESRAVFTEAAVNTSEVDGQPDAPFIIVSNSTFPITA
jgi:hypothetical protein